MKWLNKFYGYVCFAEELIAGIFLVAVMVLIFGSGVARSLGHPLRWGMDMATFLFACQDLTKYDRNYRNGKARVNPLQFREALNHLRDLLFEHMRKKERGYGRPGENRYYQAHR